MRLIDADELLKLIPPEEVCSRFAVANAPTVAVLCKDCKHRDPEDKKCDCGHDILWQLPRDDDWFCADAERRTE